MFEMSPSTIRAWLLLSVSKEPSDLADILLLADGINKAIPTLEELRDGLGWLSHHGLIDRDSGQYEYSRRGQRLVEESGRGNRAIFAHWDTLTEALAAFPDGEFVPANITEPQLKWANEIRHRRFAAIYAKISGGKGRGK